MPLDRERVIAAAIDLLDEAGLDGLSLRRLARELGVQAPALYWHFKNKQELLDQLAETIAARTQHAEPLAPGEAWDDWLAERARELRAGLNRHRDGAMLAASTRPQAVQLRNIERQLEVLCAAGLTPVDAMTALIAVSNYVSGFTLDEQADRLRGGGGDEAGLGVDEVFRFLEVYPLMSASLRTILDPNSDASFERGLQTVLDGVRAAVGRSSGSSSR
ncbi:TetR/AcrR family transcriptional regulator C-terminal domain-containing protein [Dactylosporangium sp. CS-033363]|uniref:TetR/AcrR family transcriptional regulator C-terminal domain-containing protein n=1 Tax=Dactylosporangium sp. CS-033363 TaxID=3239935 RepID=UPI003D927EC9